MSTYVEKLFGLSGDVAVIIGGAGELCGVISEGLAQAGAKIVLVDLNREKGAARLAKIKQLGGDGLFVYADVTKKHDLENVLAETTKAYGKVDILLNGAGINSGTPYIEIPEDEWQRILDVNLKSVFLGCQVFGKFLLEQKTGGSIINMASMSGIIPLSKVYTYSITKAGVINLTQNLAREWAPQNIRVNALAPGFFPAEQNRKILTEERVAKIMGHTPMNRFGEANELIAPVILLASRKAGSFMTGCTLAVDGGFSAMTI